MKKLPLVVSAGLALLTAVAAVHCGSANTDTNPAPTSQRPQDAIDGVKTTETVSLTGLQQQVRVVRDKRGMVHVYAQSLHDAAMAQGFMAARDRAPQLEILRRAAEGRLAQYAGNLQPGLADQDIFLRAMGFRRVADAYYATLTEGSDVKAALDGYAAGVTAYFRQIRSDAAHVPNGWLAIPRDKYTDWEPQSSLALARLLTWQLSYTGSDEIGFSDLHDAVAQTFPPDSTDANLKARSLIALDTMRFEPGAKDLVVPPPTASFHTMDLPPRSSFASTSIPPETMAAMKPMLDATRAVKDMLGKGDWSSNNWVISPARSATGHTLVASDPHLGLPAPAVFHMVGLHVISSDPSKALDVAGMSFAGTPGVVLGFNKHIAWGATVAVFDVNDEYLDKIHDGNVTIGGKDVAIVPITEPFDYGDGNPQSITIETIPGHGVVLPTVKDHRFTPRTNDTVVSIRWTGMEPSGELEAFLGMNKAANVDEAKKAIEDHFEVGAQNFVLGDDQGNIAYTTHALVPIRPDGARKWDASKWTGTLPCLVLPGDQGFEWTGRVDTAMLPQAKNPDKGYIATANSDQYGLVFDNDPSNDPVYLGCLWDPGFRKARVDARIEAKDKLTPDDVASIQADVKSPLGTHVAKAFSDAIKRAIASKAGTTPAPDLDAAIHDPRWDDTRMQTVTQLLDAWASSDYFAESGVAESDVTVSDAQLKAAQATTVFETAMIPLFKRVFDDEMQAMTKAHGSAPSWRKDLQWKGLIRMVEKPEPLATADASGESVLWDDMTTATVKETKDFDLVMSMLDGLDFVTKTLGTDPSGWLWGKLHTIRFATMVAGTGGQLSIPNDGDSTFPNGYPRHGDEQVVDRSDFGLGGSDYSFKFGYANGPAQRFVGDMDPAGPNARNALPGGNVWQPDSVHFDDEAQMWRKNINAPVNFSMAQVVGAYEERIDFNPQ